MYIFTSDTLESYGKGWIIVEAESIEDARKKAWLSFESWLREYREWDLYEYEEGETEYLETLVNSFDDDLNEIHYPAQIKDCILIRGSD